MGGEESKVISPQTEGADVLVQEVLNRCLHFVHGGAR